jgi:protein-disulfide isomerase
MSTTGRGSMLTMPVTPGRDHIRGPVDAPISVVEYGDFECPFCGAAHNVVDALQSRLGDDMHFVYRHFPLSTVHPHARVAAEASEAAAAQGMFWPMYDLLFANQRQLAVPDLIARAAALKLDIERFEKELLGRTYADRVQEDFMSGIYSGVNGTPSFFINGRRHDGPADLPSLIASMQRAAV